MAANIQDFIIGSKPNYIAQNDEERIFETAFRARIPMILKGPTGCGKTRFIEYMAFKLQTPLITVSCHEDLTASDLVGKYLFKENETVWQDGPLTLAARYGGICYLDEIVEARKDTMVLIHSLTDDRRILYLDKTGEVIKADDRFMMVLSYNPGYQSIVKDLKQSTKQRFASILFHYPSQTTESEIIRTETGLTDAESGKLAALGVKIRELKGFGLDEGVGTRLLVYVGRMIKAGLTPQEAGRCCIAETLIDEESVTDTIMQLFELYYGTTDREHTVEPE